MVVLNCVPCSLTNTMLWYFIIFSAFNAVFVVSIVDPGPNYRPTKGEVWPKPQQESKEENFYGFQSSLFKIKITNNNCSILANAASRYTNILANLYFINSEVSPTLTSVSNCTSDDKKYQGCLIELQLELTAPCEQYPYLGMDESYNLTVTAVSNLKSASVWGILRGLETFVQLVYHSDNFEELYINATQIVDYPRFEHRGLLLDTSRHYFTVENILKTLDGMAMDKMNVFHWHIVDDQSFPYQSEKFPDLSSRGAYHPSLVYKKSDIELIVSYARERGIRVVPEFDVPGHTSSWGVAYPNILTKCYEGGELIGLGPMNPVKNITYKLLKELFYEVQEWFPDKYVHVGGDEVELSCWSSNPGLRDYMKENNITDVNELHAIFMRNTIPLLSNTSKVIVWQEVFDERVPLSEDTLIQVWKNYWPITDMINILTAGHKVLFSSHWYFSDLTQNFGDFYMADPRKMVYDAIKNKTLADNIVGGEASMWGEWVDDSNMLSRVWPRSSGAAERLWSAELPTQYSRWHKSPVPKEALQRIEEHVCRMKRRGIPAQPASGPGFCIH